MRRCLRSNAILNEKAEQGARANATICHVSCWRTSRASWRRGSSLTLGDKRTLKNHFRSENAMSNYLAIPTKGVRPVELRRCEPGIDVADAVACRAERFR